jgi:hypothetical protein
MVKENVSQNLGESRAIIRVFRGTAPTVGGRFAKLEQDRKKERAIGPLF